MLEMRPVAYLVLIGFLYLLQLGRCDSREAAAFTGRSKVVGDDVLLTRRVANGLTVRQRDILKSKTRKRDMEKKLDGLVSSVEKTKWNTSKNKIQLESLAETVVKMSMNMKNMLNIVAESNAGMRGEQKAMKEMLNTMAKKLESVAVKEEVENLEKSVAQVGQQIKNEDFSGKMAKLDESVHRQMASLRNFTLWSASMFSEFEISGVFKGKMYLASKSIGMNYHANQRTCHERGGHLVDVDTVEEFDFVRRFLKHIPGELFLTDLQDMKTEGRFVAGHSGRPMAIDRWGKGQPDNSENEDCVVFHRPNAFYLSDVKCGAVTNYGSFVCEVAAFRDADL